MTYAENMDEKLLAILKLIEPLKFIKYIFWKRILCKT